MDFLIICVIFWLTFQIEKIVEILLEVSEDSFELIKQIYFAMEEILKLSSTQQMIMDTVIQQQKR